MNGITRKFSITLLGLFTALLLFTASFSILLENSIFNSGFYKSAFERLGTYDRILELAGKPAKELTTKISGPSAAVFSSKTTIDGIDNQKTSFKSLVDANVTNNMVRINVNSLIDGLASYFKGETNSLPDLHLTGMDSLKNVNLQVLIMYAGENKLSNILHLISLSQYALNHIPELPLLLFPFILVFMLKKPVGEIYSWLINTAFFYCMVSMVAALLIQLLPRISMNYVLAHVDAFQPSLTGLVSNHLLYFSNLFATSILFSGSLLYIGIRTVGRVVESSVKQIGESSVRNKRVNSSGYMGLISGLRLYSDISVLKVSDFDDSSLCKTKVRRNILMITIILLSGFLFYINIQSASKEFENRNIGQSLILLWGNNPLFHVTDARNDLVYLLEIHIAHRNAKKPASNIGVNIGSINEQGSGFQSHSCLTDIDGNATYMLSKGKYILSLDAGNTVASQIDTHLYTYRFEMQTPGKSVLNILLNDSPDGMPSVANVSLQYMP